MKVYKLIIWVTLIAAILYLALPPMSALNTFTPKMSGNFTPAGNVCHASSELDQTDFPAHKAFDHLTSSGYGWYSAVNTTPAFLEIRMSNTSVAQNYTIFYGTASSATEDGDRLPKSWTFEGSNNITVWDVLDSRTGIAWNRTVKVKQVFNFTNTKAYTNYRINITANNGGNYHAIGELFINGEPSVNQLYYYAYGDSVTRGTGYSDLSPTGDDVYIVQMQRRYDSTASVSHNQDGGGQNTDWGIRNFETHPGVPYPTKFFIMLGVNDRATLETYPANTTADHLIKISDMAVANGSIPYILLEPADYDTGGWSNFTTQKDNMTKIETRLTEMRYPFFKAYDEVDSIPGNGIFDPTNATTSAGVHPNVSGHSLIADGLWRYINKPVAQISPTGTNQTIWLPPGIGFRDISTNTPTEWLWDFGDGKTSILKNPVHYWPHGSTYTIVLNASNAYGYSTNTTTVTVY